MAELNEQLVQVARQAIEQARAEGLGEEDVTWMAIGACMRYGREQGTIGEELTPEMNAALHTLVWTQMDVLEPRLRRCPYCGQMHQAELVDQCPLKPA